jgi:hypothetical protein
MLCRVALVRTDVSEERSASIIRVTRIGELETTLAVTSNWYTLRRLLVTANVVPNSPILVTLMMEALHSSETSLLTRATRRNIPEDAILYGHAVHLHSSEPSSYKIHLNVIVAFLMVPHQEFCPPELWKHSLSAHSTCRPHRSLPKGRVMNRTRKVLLAYIYSPAGLLVY